MDISAITDSAVAATTLVLAFLTRQGLKKADEGLDIARANAGEAARSAEAALAVAAIARDQLAEEQRALDFATAPRLVPELRCTQQNEGEWLFRVMNEGPAAAYDAELTLFDETGAALDTETWKRVAAAGEPGGMSVLVTRLKSGEAKMLITEAFYRSEVGISYCSRASYVRHEQHQEYVREDWDIARSHRVRGWETFEGAEELAY